MHLKAEKHRGGTIIYDITKRTVMKELFGL